jgi:hypothetical protein
VDGGSGFLRQRYRHLDDRSSLSCTRGAAKRNCVYPAPGRMPDKSLRSTPKRIAHADPFSPPRESRRLTRFPPDPFPRTCPFPAPVSERRGAPFGRTPALDSRASDRNVKRLFRGVAWIQRVVARPPATECPILGFGSFGSAGVQGASASRRAADAWRNPNDNLIPVTG